MRPPLSAVPTPEQTCVRIPDATRIRGICRAFCPALPPALALACGCFLMLAPAGCWREAPPEIREYAPVPVPAVQLAKAEEPEETVSAPQAAAPAAAPPKVETAAKTPQLPETRPAEAPSPAKTAPPEPKAPTLVGTWRLVEGSERGQPMPPGMDVQFTFAADGTLSMRIAMPQMPEPRSQSGTYSVDGDQITISIERDTKSGKLTFEGNDRATLEVETVKFVLRRL